MSKDNVIIACIICIQVSNLIMFWKIKKAIKKLKENK